MERVWRRPNRENLQEAFLLAETELDIPQLLDPEGKLHFLFYFVETLSLSLLRIELIINHIPTTSWDQINSTVICLSITVSFSLSYIIFNRKQHDLLALHHIELFCFVLSTS